MRITETFDSAANLSASPYNWRTQSGVTTFAASGGVVTAPTSGERTNFFPSAFDTLDQEVEFELVNLPTASSYFDLFARVRATGTNYGGYYVGPEYISGTGWCISLYKYTGDTYTLGIQSTTTLTAGDRIKVEAKVDGTSCRISVYRNGNKITLTGISGTVSADAGDWVDSSPLTGLWGGMYSDADGGSAAWQWDNLAAGDIGVGSGAVTQAGFRFYEDDATPAAAQNTNVERPLDVNTIVRFLLQAEGDPDAIQFKLKARFNGAGIYRDVPVVGAYPGITMSQALSWGTGPNPSPQNVVIPVETTAFYLYIAGWGNTDPFPLTPTLGGLGPDQTIGLPTGGEIITGGYVFAWRNPPTGTQELAVTFTSEITFGPCSFVVGVVGEGSLWRDADADVNGDSSEAAVTIDTQPGDLVLKFETHVDHSTTPPPLQSGFTELQTQTQMGNGDGARLSYRIADSTSQTASLTSNYPNVVAISIPAGPRIEIAPSDNISAGAADETVQLLTGGTGTFVAGRIADDVNQLPSINIGEDGNTEIAWNLRIQSPAEAGDYWDLRVYAGDDPLDAYDQTARITVAGGGAVASPSVAETVMTAVGALVSAGASVLIPVALTAMQAFAPSIGTGGIVAPSPALTSVEALSPAVAGGAQVVPETGRTTVAAFAPMAGSGVAAAAPVARSVVLALEPGVASGAAVQASTATTRAAAFLPLVGAGAIVQPQVAGTVAHAFPPLVGAGAIAQPQVAGTVAHAFPPLVGAGAIAQPQVAGTVAHAFPPEVVMGFSVPAAVTRSIALEPEVAGGAAAFPPVARSLARGFDPAAGTGVLVAPLYGATVQNALAPTVAVSVAARPAAARTAALASDPVVAAGANVSAPAARAAVAAFDPAVLASVGVEVEVPVALSRVLTRPPVAYVDDGLPAIAEILVLWGRSASIRIMSSMKTINERTSSAVRVAFRDMDRKPITPLAVEYRIDDEAGVTIRDWSSTPADQELTIEVSDEDNRILNPTRPFETRIMTVRASYGPGKGASEEYRWRVRNLRFQS